MNTLNMDAHHARQIEEQEEETMDRGTTRLERTALDRAIKRIEVLREPLEARRISFREWKQLSAEAQATYHREVVAPLNELDDEESIIWKRFEDVRWEPERLYR